MITIICTAQTPPELPPALVGISTPNQYARGERVQIEMANGARELLGFGRVMACRPDGEWPGRYRFDVEVLE